MVSGEVYFVEFLSALERHISGIISADWINMEPAYIFDRYIRPAEEAHLPKDLKDIRSESWILSQH